MPLTSIRIAAIRWMPLSMKINNIAAPTATMMPKIKLIRALLIGLFGS
ncbi:MAG: hypothetical protein ABJD68_05630 [Nakamurella sp.]